MSRILDIRTKRVKELHICAKQLCLLERVLQLWLGQSFDFVVALQR